MDRRLKAGEGVNGDRETELKGDRETSKGRGKEFKEKEKVL